MVTSTERLYTPYEVKVVLRKQRNLILDAVIKALYAILEGGSLVLPLQFKGATGRT